MDIPRLPDAEFAVMEAVWRIGGPTTSAMIAECVDAKKWSQTTILTFLSRLSEKGFLKVRKEGKQNVYDVLVGEEDYVKSESKSFLKRLHSGSITNLVASLYDSKSISEADLEELRRFIDEK